MARMPFASSRESLRSSAVAAWMILVAGAALPVFSAGAAAQQTRMISVTSEDSGSGPSAARKISGESVERYSKALSLSEDQKAGVRALHEGYQAAFDRASKDLRDAMAEIRRSSEESQDWSVWRDKMPAAQKKYNDAVAELEKGFLGDVRAMLTSEQESGWPKVERQRRRETTLRSGMLSGETVDLLSIIDGLKLAADARSPLEPALNEYELDLDRALAAKQRVQSERGAAFEPGKPMDLTAMQERINQSREAGLKVRDVNERHARKIAAMLPESARAAFDQAVRRESFPRVYRPSGVARSMEAALKFDDLEGRQKESIAALQAQYEREAAGVNDRWAGAIQESEKAGGQGGGFETAGGQRVMIGFGGEQQEGPLAEARKARRELDDKTREKLESVLTKAQKERLPRNREGGGMGGPGGDHMEMVITGGQEGGTFVPAVPPAPPK